MEGTHNIDFLRNNIEHQTFDRKSVRIDCKGLAVAITAMANTDGGIVVIGIEDDGKVTGIDKYLSHVNELLRVPIDYCTPAVDVKTEYIPCVNDEGIDDHVLIFHVGAGNRLHSTISDEVYLRTGDKSRKLNFEERMRLTFAKGVRYYEDEPVVDSCIEDINIASVEDYCQTIGYKKDWITYLKSNKGFIVNNNGKETLSGAALLLFGETPQQWFQRARVRVIRYEGNVELTGTQMNVVKDESFEGRIIDVTRDTLNFVKTQIGDHTFLGEGAIFKTVPDYPEYCWTELIVNAIAHRDYSILGTDVQVKIFSDRFTVESPGILPGQVRLDNMRQTHFSRNPKIAQVMHDYGFVKEFGEGIDRIFNEMSAVGLPAPEFSQTGFILRATIKKVNNGKTTEKTTEKILEILKSNPKITMADIAKTLNLSQDGIYFHIKNLRDAGIIARMGGRKNGSWIILTK